MKAEQHVGEVVARLAVEPPHDAEIDRADVAGAVHEHVAGMLIGMEVAVAEHLIEEDGGRLGENGVDVVAGGHDQGLPIVHGNAGDALLRHHPPGRAAPVDGGHAIGGVVGEILGQLRRRGGLEPQIHLDPHGRGEGLDHVDRLQAPQLGLGALDQLAPASA